MRAYTRELGKQLALHEIREALEKSRKGVRAVDSPAEWARFAEVFEDAIDQHGKAERLRTMAHALKYRIQQVHACGAERETQAEWCGSIYGPNAARQRASQAVRHARRSWPQQVLTVEIPIGRAGGLKLPSKEAVASVRAAWGPISKQVATSCGIERPELNPRAVVTPDGVTLFVQIEGRGQAQLENLASSVRLAARWIGLRGVDARWASREAAIQTLYQALMCEAQRFMAEASVELEQLEDGTAEARAGLGQVWVERALARGRRQVVLGAKTSLEVDLKTPKGTERPCPSHGVGCPVVAQTVRERGTGTLRWRGANELAPNAPTVQVATFLKQALSAPAPVQTIRRAA
ncbi:MAG: hypothetical protein KDD82_03790 [Planctomycetes bacterium]|nr:hypothetical protein [Planctomycetota bacterium]